MWLVLSAALADEVDAPKACGACDAWNEPQEPFRLWGDSWYVGVGGLSVVLVRTSEGAILLDGGLPQSVPLIEENLRAVGSSLEEVRYIAVSHAHFDHVGGVAALQRRSGATVVATADAARALAAGGPLPDDPQFAFGPEANAFPPVSGARVLADGESVALGGVTLVLHTTPGHTPGGATWSWRSCDAEGRCADLVFADSLNPVSADGYRFADGAGDALAASLAKVEALPCDLIVAVHPGFTDLFDRRTDEGAALDPRGCQVYARGAERALKKRLRAER